MGSIQLTRSGSDTKTTVATSNVDGITRWTIAGQLPGRYKAQVVNRQWCWYEDKLEFDVAEVDVLDLKFEQIGYDLRGTVSHDVLLNITLVEAKGVAESGQIEQPYPAPIQQRRGPMQMCLVKPGKYFLAVQSCYRFKQQEFSFHTDEFRQQQEINLLASHFLVKGTVEMDHEETGSLSVDGPRGLNIIVEFKQSNGVKVGEVDATYAELKNGQHIWNYEYWAKAADDLLVRVVTKEALRHVIFHPRELVLAIRDAMEQNKCPPPFQPFHAKLGQTLRGKVTPPIAGVEISIMMAGSDVPAEVVHTDEFGAYETGPLFEDQVFEVVVRHEGFHFEPDPNSLRSFIALRYSSANITVLEKLEDGTTIPLPGVLLSLSSSSDQFRANHRTNADGSYFFSQLFPDTYYLRPLLKEYEFVPPQSTVVVQQGELTSVVLEARRVAHSCTGTLRILSKESRADMGDFSVHASSLEGGEIEEAIVEASGHYTLHGLLPHVTYEITARSSSSHGRFERTSPPKRVFSVEKTDVTGADFVVFTLPTTMTLSGDATDITHAMVSKLEVELVSASGGAKAHPVVAPIGPVKYFEFPRLVPGHYRLQLLGPRGTPIWKHEVTLEPSIASPWRVHVHIPQDALTGMDADSLLGEVPGTMGLQSSPSLAFLVVGAVVVLVLRTVGVLSDANLNRILMSLQASQSPTAVPQRQREERTRREAPKSVPKALTQKRKAHSPTPVVSHDSQ